MFNFKTPSNRANKPVVRLCIGKRDNKSLTHQDWIEWPADFPIPNVGDYVHQNGNLRAQVMWIDYDYFLNKVHIFAGLLDSPAPNISEEANRSW